MTNEQLGARFFDEHKRDRGFATNVVKREKGLGRLIVLDVTSTEPALLSFLGALDRSPLQVQPSGAANAGYRFVWASGYENGPTVRVQGILQDA